MAQLGGVGSAGNWRSARLARELRAAIREQNFIDVVDSAPPGSAAVGGAAVGGAAVGGAPPGPVQEAARAAA